MPGVAAPEEQSKPINTDSTGDSGVATHLLSTFFNFEPFKRVFWEVKPDSVCLFTQKEATAEGKAELRKLDAALKEFSGMFQKKVITVPMYGIHEIAVKAVEVIDSLKPKKGDRVIVNITSGRKPMALGLLYAAYARPKLVSQVMYLTEEHEEVIQLPMMYYNLSKSEKQLLLHIRDQGTGTILAMSGALGLSRSMLYKNLSDLSDQGLLREADDDWELTDFGRIAVL